MEHPQVAAARGCQKEAVSEAALLAAPHIERFSQQIKCLKRTSYRSLSASGEVIYLHRRLGAEHFMLRLVLRLPLSFRVSRQPVCFACLIDRENSSFIFAVELLLQRLPKRFSNFRG